MRFLLILTLTAFAAPAFAYIGPGPGLSMLGSLFALVAGVLIALAMVILYPLRLFLKRRRQAAQKDSSES